jgi:hypothetical protein
LIPLHTYATEQHVQHFNLQYQVDGVTRTLARLLEHLEREGHECMVLGPQTGMVSLARVQGWQENVAVAVAVAVADKMVMARPDTLRIASSCWNFGYPSRCLLGSQGKELQ